LQEGARLFEPTPGKRMREYIVLPVEIVGDRQRLRALMSDALVHASSLAPKQEMGKRATKEKAVVPKRRAATKKRMPKKTSARKATPGTKTRARMAKPTKKAAHEATLPRGRRTRVSGKNTR
jgi:hypothetical protein